MRKRLFEATLLISILLATDVGIAENARSVDGITGASFLMPTLPRPAEDIRRIMQDWLQTHWFMSLATADSQGQPYAGGVTFYVEDMVVYFKTRKSSTKAVNIVQNSNVSYTVWDTVDDMKDLKALQVVGRARILEGEERDRIASILDGAKGSTKSNLEQFFRTAGIQRNYSGSPFDAENYIVVAIDPYVARFNDNSISMGHSDIYQFPSSSEKPEP